MIDLLAIACPAAQTCHTAGDQGTITRTVNGTAFVADGRPPLPICTASPVSMRSPVAQWAMAAPSLAAGDRVPLEAVVAVTLVIARTRQSPGRLIGRGLGVLGK